MFGPGLPLRFRRRIGQTPHREGQVLIRLCESQPSLWTTSDVCFGLVVWRADESSDSHEKTPDGTTDQSGKLEVVDILDIIHVVGYVWLVGRTFFGIDEVSLERFVRSRLQGVLAGGVTVVITGIRSMVSRRTLKGEEVNEVGKARNYFENNVARMRYAEYLQAGYPIANGVIEGAYHHLVKDRMERTEMRWRQSSAGSILRAKT